MHEQRCCASTIVKLCRGLRGETDLKRMRLLTYEESVKAKLGSHKAYIKAETFLQNSNEG